MPLSPARARARRRLWGWVPTVVLVLVCTGFVAAAVTMQNSWWTNPSATPAADQRAADGMSRFDRAGEDYFVREGVVRVSLRTDASAAEDLGLEPDGVKTIEPLVPVTVVVLAPDGVLALETVSALTLQTAAGRVSAVTLSPDLPGSWQAVTADLHRTAQAWGFGDTEVAALSDALTEASRESGDGTAEATLAPRDVRGAMVGAEIRVDGGVTLSYTIAAP